VNNQIYQNAAGPSSGDNGGGLYDCDSDIRNNTIISNHCSGSGGGMRNCDGTGVNIRSNIIYFNTADQGANQLSNCNDPSWCCIENWNGGGSGNRGGDPELANISPIFAHTLWDLRLTAASTSCIDKGSDSNAPTIDFDNNARPFNNTGVSNGTGGTTDIGCFERRIND
jgi:hypothetical protein